MSALADRLRPTALRGTPLKPLAEQVVVVFGASSGIGRATALAAVAQGAKVVAAARGREGLDSLAADVAHPDAIDTVTADAVRPDEVDAVAQRAVERFGRVDTWAHVAGEAVYGRFEDTPARDFARIVEVDLLGVANGCRAALPRLRDTGRGALVVVSSELAKRSFPLASAYCAAKHGVNGLLESLRVELAHEGAGIQVAEIQPAAIDTPFFEHARTYLGVRPSGPPPVYPPERVADAILSAAQFPKREVVVGGAAQAQLLLQRLSPRIMDAFALATAFRLQRSDEAKAPDDPDAVDTPVDGDDRVHGVVGNTSR